jgi:type III restriction enzyme
MNPQEQDRPGLTERKAQDQLMQVDMIRKKNAAVAWCERLNELPPEQCIRRTWDYCLHGEAQFYEFRQKGATMKEILQFSRVRAKSPKNKGFLIDLKIWPNVLI